MRVRSLGGPALCLTSGRSNGVLTPYGRIVPELQVSGVPIVYDNLGAVAYENGWFHFVLK